ncbi:stalk domain-containing protein [Paenibacillus lautus]|uniref:stalk domain-containing protein n=1 Tax=Paenibacillus lautus TaxID=1401 RepID=UPI003530F289
MKKKEGAAKVSDIVKVFAYGKSIKDGMLIDGTVYVPLRAVAEARGDKVSWDNATKTAMITK